MPYLANSNQHAMSAGDVKEIRVRKRTPPPPPAHRPVRRKPFDPHHFVGKIVVYGLAADGAIRFIHWLTISIAAEFRH